mgnify:CR=1 FL=1
MAFSLFTQVALKEDIPEYNLQKGDIATIVEYYPTQEGEEDGYSLEGFNLPQVTLEVTESQIKAVSKRNCSEVTVENLTEKN